MLANQEVTTPGWGRAGYNQPVQAMSWHLGLNPRFKVEFDKNSTQRPISATRGLGRRPCQDDHQQDIQEGQTYLDNVSLPRNLYHWEEPGFVEQYSLLPGMG